MWHHVAEMRFFFFPIALVGKIMLFFPPVEKTTRQNLVLFFHADVTVHGPTMSLSVSPFTLHLSPALHPNPQLQFQSTRRYVCLYSTEKFKLMFRSQ